MAKKNAPLETSPTGDTLTAEEQAFFDSAGESEIAGGEDDGAQIADTSAPIDDGAGATDDDASSDEGALEDGSAEEQQTQRQKMVPHAALHEERLRAKEFRDRAERAEEERTKLMARVNELFDRQMAAPQQQQQQEEDPAPDPNEDPIAYLSWVSQKLASKQEETDRFIAEQRQQSQQTAVLSTLQSEALASETSFRNEHPDYDQASQFMQNSRLNEMRAMGYTDAQAQQALRQEAIGIAAHAKENNLNPAQVIYDMAKARGYQLTPGADIGDSDGAADGTQTGQDAKQQIERVAAGQRQTRSLSQARGSAPAPMTAQRLIEMDDGEFESFRSKNPKEFRALMGS